MNGLTDEQLAFYEEEGYLLIEDVLPPQVFQLLISEVERDIDQRAREAQQAGRLEDLYEDQPFERRLARICTTLEGEVESFWHFSGDKYKSEGMFSVMTHPAILDIVESVIGPEILAHPQFNLRAKLPGQEVTVVPWHQDLAYLMREAEDTFLVNFWIPLVDATVENGCMEVIAGSHKCDLIQHDRIRTYRGILEGNLPPGERIACPLRAGGVLLTQHKIAHRSIANTSDHIRWSLDLRYSDPAMPTGRDSVPGFIARSAADPQSVATGLADWLKRIET
jgi:ectoine hydroxylase-related dioxygenase (phytanoyl-CoA dioxygenase family)